MLAPGVPGEGKGDDVRDYSPFTFRSRGNLMQNYCVIDCKYFTCFWFGATCTS